MSRVRDRALPLCAAFKPLWRPSLRDETIGSVGHRAIAVRRPIGAYEERGWKWPRAKSVERFKEVLRDQTARTDGRSLPEIIGRLNRRLRGWAGYFAGGNGHLYPRLDPWLRMRLRSILRKRERRQGRGRGLDHQRYPNDSFVEHGLISLNALTRAKRASPA